MPTRTKEMISRILKNLQIDTLNDMQEAAITAAKNKDVVLLSPTGSGKTLAFLLPVLAALDTEKKGIQALILVPSRELALQIEQVWRQLSTGFKINCCYGGHATRIEKNNLAHAPALLVGTPGRIAYHLRDANIDGHTISTLVLDEFDKSLELGFQDEMEFIIGSLPSLGRRILTSATDLRDIPTFVGLSEAASKVDFLQTGAHMPNLTLKAVNTKAEDKHNTLFSLICLIGNQPTLVFCNHREAVNRISDMLHESEIDHGVFHGGMEQSEREKELLKFRNGTYHLLITTDLAARGLDIPEIACIVHYQLPNEDAFIHRNGRTARMRADGTAYVLVHNEEIPEYIKEKPEMIVLPAEETLPTPSPWCTVYIAAGKKDKVNKVDIVGLLLQKGKLNKDDLGRIDVYDHAAFAAVKRNKVNQMMKLAAAERIKNKKVKMEISR